MISSAFGSTCVGFPSAFGAGAAWNPFAAGETKTRARARTAEATDVVFMALLLLDRVALGLEAGAVGLGEGLARRARRSLRLRLRLLLLLFLPLLRLAAAAHRTGHGSDRGSLAGVAGDRPDGRPYRRPLGALLDHAAVGAGVHRRRGGRGRRRVDAGLLLGPAVARHLVRPLLLGRLVLRGESIDAELLRARDLGGGAGRDERHE